MLKQFRVVFLALLAVGFLASCNTSAESSAQEEARNDLEQSTPQSANNPAMANQPQQATAEQAVPAGPTTVMTFAETEYDFGTVTEGEKVAYTYKFTNNGDEPLILSNAKGSCGCTVPKWPREPIAPGESGEVTVEFNSKNKKGKRNQKVTITANTNPPQTFLFLKGEVLAGEGSTDAAAPKINVQQPN
jgi:hypothetical protein